MADLNISKTLSEAKDHLDQFNKGKYTAEPMCHALADSIEKLIRYIEDYIEDDMR
jgi:hypothetical protein